MFDVSIDSSIKKDNIKSIDEIMYKSIEFIIESTIKDYYNRASSNVAWQSVDDSDLITEILDYNIAIFMPFKCVNTLDTITVLYSTYVRVTICKRGLIKSINRRINLEKLLEEDE